MRHINKNEARIVGRRRNPATGEYYSGRRRNPTTGEYYDLISPRIINRAILNDVQYQDLKNIVEDTLISNGIDKDPSYQSSDLLINKTYRPVVNIILDSNILISGSYKTYHDYDKDNKELIDKLLVKLKDNINKEAEFTTIIVGLIRRLISMGYNVIGFSGTVVYTIDILSKEDGSLI